MRTLVTMALPYANGSLHLGHFVEAIQTDVYVRALRALGRQVAFICADDMHGTPIEMSAAKAGLPPEQYVEGIHREHREDYAAFHISHDEFYKTHSEENRVHTERIYRKLVERGSIDRREVEQLYCEVDRRFLPDRYVRGTCPVCGAKDQYGDACEVCGSTYEPVQLKDAYCAICKDGGRGYVRPVLRRSAHYFVKLSDYQDFLRKWTTEPGHVQPEIRGFLARWLAEPLKDWDISRDEPYFGFEIPDRPPAEEKKYFYVWLDAPTGYLSSTEHWARKRGRTVEEWWGADSGTEIVHFIGKDIVYFHTLFWPAMLHASGWRVPARVHVHGMLTVEGTKMSKTRGTFINAREYLDAGLDPEWLRYYFAANLGPTASDIDLSLGEMKNRVNGE
ncbi:MAG: methionine--tRNA ligase, partial [Myxococcales bacterium]